MRISDWSSDVCSSGLQRGRMVSMATQQVTAKLCEDPEADAALEASFLAIREGRDPTPFYHVLRTRSPVYFSRRRNMWLLTGHSEVDQVLRSPVAHLQSTTRRDDMRPPWRSPPRTV